MTRLFKIALMAVMVFFLAGLAHAVPVLQLDIGGPDDSVYYDFDDDTIKIDEESEFTIYALLNPKGDDDGTGEAPNAPDGGWLAETYYLSIALTPRMDDDPVDFGTFSVDGDLFDTSTMDYGAPPVEIDAHNKDLAGHGIFDTYFSQIDFMFDDSMTVGEYNSENDYGDFDDFFPGEGMYYIAFEVDLSGINEDAEIGIHFDLFSVEGDEDEPWDENSNIFVKAPFSHDAEGTPGDGGGGTNIVPEPGTMLLLGTGLLAAVGTTRRKRKGV